MRVPLADVDESLATARGWWVEVTVRVRTPAHHYNADDPSKCVRNTVVYDDTGEISITCFDGAADLLCRDPPGTLVRISGAAVEATRNPRFAKARHACELVARGATRVCPMGPGPPPCPLEGDVVGRVTGARPWTDAFGPGGGWTLALAVDDGHVAGDCALEHPPPVGARVLVRGAARHGEHLTWSDVATLHVLSTPVRPPPHVAFRGPPVVRIADVEALIRDGQPRVRVRALLVWHSALDAHSRPHQWTARGKRGRGSAARVARLRVRCRLSDASGSLEEVWASDATAASFFGAQHAELLAMTRPEFGRATTAPMFRWTEWTIDGERSADDESLYLRLGGAARPIFSEA
jgi:hypothetical protein